MIKLLLWFAVVLDVGVFDPVKAFMKEKTRRQTVSQVLLQSDMIFVLQMFGLAVRAGVWGRGLRAGSSCL